MARNPNDQLARARALLQTANAPSAQALIEAVLAKAPANPEANYLLGMIRLMAGDALAAEAPLQITLRSDPGNGMALDSLGLCYLMQGRFIDAEPVLRKAAANPRAPAVVVMRLGLALLEQKKSTSPMRAITVPGTYTQALAPASQLVFKWEFHRLIQNSESVGL